MICNSVVAIGRLAEINGVEVLAVALEEELNAEEFG